MLMKEFYEDKNIKIIYYFQGRQTSETYLKLNTSRLQTYLLSISTKRKDFFAIYFCLYKSFVSLYLLLSIMFTIVEFYILWFLQTVLYNKIYKCFEIWKNGDIFIRLGLCIIFSNNKILRNWTGKLLKKDERKRLSMSFFKKKWKCFSY